MSDTVKLPDMPATHQTYDYDETDMQHYARAAVALNSTPAAQPLDRNALELVERVRRELNRRSYSCYIHSDFQRGWDGLCDYLCEVISRAANTQEPENADAEPEWIVNSYGELGVKVNGRYFFLYKGDNIVYGQKLDCLISNGIVLDELDGSPMKYRQVGKYEFGEVCQPEKFTIKGIRVPQPYTEALTYTPGLSDGQPGDADWQPLPADTAQDSK